MKYLLVLSILSVFSMCCMNNSYADRPAVYVDSLEDAEVLSERTNQKILIIFSAKWCKYCGLLSRFLKENSTLLNNYIVVIIDYDTNKDLVKQYAVRNLPDSRIINKGKELSSMVGYDKQEYIQWLETHK